MTSNQPSQIKGARLRTRIFSAFILLIVLPAFVLTLLPLFFYANRELSRTTADLEQLTANDEAALLAWAEDAKADLFATSRNSFLRSLAISQLAIEPGSSTNTGFSSYVSTLNIPFDTVLLLNPDGIVHATDTRSRLGADVAGEEWFQRALNSPDLENVIITGPYYDPVDEQQSIYFSIPFVEQGEVIGVLAGRTGAEQLADILNRSPLPGSTVDLYLVRAGQQYVVPPRLGDDDMMANGDIAAAVLDGENGSGRWEDYRGENVTGAYRWIDELNLGIVAKQDVSEITAASRALVRFQLLLGVGAVLVTLTLAFVLTQRITRSMSHAGEIAESIAAGKLDVQLPHSPLREVNQFGETINRLTSRLRETIYNQEDIIAARTRDLTITSRMGQAIAARTDLNELLQSTINLIRDQLGYYHAQVFLLDDLGKNAVLRASMGEAGKEMLARAHHLAVGSRSVVGQAAGRRVPALASDTAHAEFWRPNPLLPDTRAELAMPLIFGDEVLGVLDIQSTDTDAFDEHTIGVLEIVADQLAVAIHNAQLLREKDELLAASVELTQTLTEEQWEDYTRQRREAGSLGFQYDLSAVRPLDDGGSNGSTAQVKLPIALRGTVIGDLSAQLDEGRVLTSEEQQLVTQMLDRVALALDNARLIEQTQLSLQETNRLYQATQNIAAANSIDEVVAELVNVSMLDTVDRAALFMIEESSGEATWVRTAGLNLRSEDDPIPDIHEHMQLDDHVMLMNVENIPVGEFVINNIEDALLDPAMKDELLACGTRAMATFAITPAITGGDTLGWLVLHSTREAEAFNNDDVRFIETIIDQAATALEGLHLFEQTQVRARRLQATNEVSRAAASILNLDVLLPLVVDSISEAFGYYHAQIFLIDELGEWAELKASTGEIGQVLMERNHRLAVGSRSVIGEVTSTGEAVVINDILQDPTHRPNALLPETRSEMALPLVAGNRIIGALDVQSTQVMMFDDEARAILQSLADQIAVTLENTTLFEEIQERVSELTTVNLVSQVVSRAQTPDELYRVVTDQMIDSFDAQYGFLGVVEADGNLHLPIFIEGGERVESPEPFAPEDSLSGHVLQTGEVLIINENTQEHARQLGAKMQGTMPRSLLIAPLLVGDEIIGVISLQDAENEYAYDDSDVRQLTTLAAYVAVKIRNAELLEQAQQRASELGFLFEITRTAVATTVLQDALTDVSDIMLREVPGAESVTFYLAEDDVFEAEAGVGYGREAVAKSLRMQTGEGLVGAAALAGQPLLIANANLSRHSTGSLSRTKSAIAVPLKSGQQVVGVLAVESTQPGAFEERDLSLLEGAAGTLTAVIQGARLLDEITRTNEQLRELDTLKSQFLANMSHELRTPLNSIIGFSRVILKGIDGPLTDLQKQDLTTIFNSGQHLLGLINNILDLSKIEAGKMEIQPEYMDIYETIDTVISTGRGLVKDKDVDLRRDVEEGISSVYGDPMRVRQILLNLVSNASKFTHEGSITLRVRRKPYNPETSEPPRIQIDVQDTGIGIAQEDMRKLFQAFSQVDGSTTRQAGGTGLGLNISKQFVELMGGRIWVESEPGAGSTFSFTVPLYPPGSPISEIVLATEFSDDRPVVLAVDDEPGVLDLYARYLEKAGYGLVGLNNAGDIVEHAREIRPSAIVIDLHLPGKSGWDAVRELKQAEDTAAIPIMVCSIEEKSPNRLMNQISAYLVKPVIEDDLLYALSQATGSTEIRDVLIVDPDEAFATAAAGILTSSLECTVYHLATGLGGLETLYEHCPDLLIMDIDLPDMDGYGLLTSLRSQEGYAHLPVVILTSRELSGEDIARLGADTTFYIRKNGQDYGPLLQTLPGILNGIGV